MDGVTLTPLKQIYNPKGNIFHAMKKNDDGFDGFGEAYFSTVRKDDIKGWKKHTKMTLNLIVPVGTIEFVVYDENAKEFFSAGAPLAPTPITCIFGFISLIAHAIPEISPPPPTGMITASKSLQLSNISRATVPCPAITSSSSKG